MQTLNKKQAAEYAGYTHESTRRHAYSIFNRPHVREAIELLLQAWTGASPKPGLLISSSSLRRRRRPTFTSALPKDSDEIDPENIGAVAEIEETPVTDKKGQRRGHHQDQAAQPPSGAEGLG